MMNLKDRDGIEQITQDMTFMCATVGTRVAGSPEEERVADYVLERFRGLGLSGIEKLPFSCRGWRPGRAELTVLASRSSTSSGQENRPLIPVQQVTHTPATPPEGIEGELVIFEPVDWEHGLRRDDLDGKIGLFLGGYGESAEVFQQLHESALEAIVIVDTRMQTDWPIAEGVGEKFMGLVRKPMAGMSQMDAWSLAREGATRVRLTSSGHAEPATSWNVVGELPGDDPQGRVLVVSGHIDSVSIGEGADDDASGIAAALECARRLRGCDRRHTVRFVGFGAEEQLSVGSARYVNGQVQDLDRIGFACNFDGIAAHLGLSTVMCTGTPDLHTYVKGIVDEKLQFGQATSDVSPYQDQFWFTANGIPGIWITRKTHKQAYWYHHSEHNSLDVVSFEQIAWAAEAACDMLAELAAKERWPFEREVSADLREKIDRYLRELF